MLSSRIVQRSADHHLVVTQFSGVTGSCARISPLHAPKFSPSTNIGVAEWTALSSQKTQWGDDLEALASFGDLSDVSIDLLADQTEILHGAGSIPGHVGSTGELGARRKGVVDCGDEHVCLETAGLAEDDGVVFEGVFPDLVADLDGKLEDAGKHPDVAVLWRWLC